MTVLRQKMIDDMQLHGFAVRTQEAYVLAVSQLAKHYHKAPDQIEEEELRQYFLFLKNEKHAARASCTIALCGIKFFSRRTSGRCMNVRWVGNGRPSSFYALQRRKSCPWS